MIIDRWQELLIGTKTQQRVLLSPKETLFIEGGEKIVRSGEQGRWRQGNTYLAQVGHRHSPPIYMDEWKNGVGKLQPGVATAMPFIQFRYVIVNDEWYDMTDFEGDITFERINGKRYAKKDFHSVQVTITDLWEQDARDLAPTELEKEGFPSYLEFYLWWCQHYDRGVMKRLNNLKSRTGLPEAERNRVLHNVLIERPNDRYRGLVMELE